MAETQMSVETTPLSKKIVPIRGAAQKAALILKEQITKRPRKKTDSSTLADTADESDLTELTEEEDDGDIMTQKHSRRETGAEGSKTRGRGRRRGATVRGDGRQLSTRRKVGRKSLKAVPVSVPAKLESSSRSASPVASGSLSPLRLTQTSMPHSTSKGPKITVPRKPQPSTSFDNGLSNRPFPTLSPKKYANVFIKHDMIWVRLNSQGSLASLEVEQPNQSYWWPAQVTEDDPLYVSARLFGNDGHGNDRFIDIEHPSLTIVCPFRAEDGELQFSSTTFALTPTPAVMDEDPFFSEPSSSLVQRWADAINKALEAESEVELPEAPSLISLMSASRKRKQKEEYPPISQTLTPTSSTKRPFMPLDEDIKFGQENGEMVLARDHKDRPDHWPARVVGVSQDRKTGKWLYEICFMDGKKKKMERDRFFSTDQEGFAVCQLGKWQTFFPESDSEAPDSEDEFHRRHERRSVSPSPSNPGLDDIQDTDAFCGLPLAKQLHYVYPFLCRVTRRQYEPSFERHDAFIKGGKGREQLGQAAASRGHFSENEMKKVSLLVRRTMLRDERWAERVEDEDKKRGDARETDPPDEPESVVDSVIGRSSDFDAALALTELHSLDHTHDRPPISLPCSSYSDNLTSSESLTSGSRPTGVEMNAPNLTYSAVLDRPSEMDMDTEGVQISSSPLSSHKAIEYPKIETHIIPTTAEAVNFGGPFTKNETRFQSRPIGCDDYENLSRSERSLYCADVLLPEAVLQLHLLRDGRRTSTHLRSSQEEKDLYKEGLKLVKLEVHWVTQIMQLRSLAENAIKRKRRRQEVREAGSVVEVLKGTSTRPKTLRVSR